jgi:hypothetical protein
VLLSNRRHPWDGMEPSLSAGIVCKDPGQQSNPHDPLAKQYPLPRMCYKGAHPLTDGHVMVDGCRCSQPGRHGCTHGSCVLNCCTSYLLPAERAAY